MTVSHDRCGVVIVGVNKGADIKATRTADSVKKHMPDMHITLFTDQPIWANIPSIDKIVRIPSKSDEPSLEDANQTPDQGIAAKMTYIHKCDYEYTLYLDYDIYITDSVWEIFDALEYGGFDLALTQYQFHECNYTEIPCFPYYNAGMLAWKKNKNTDEFFRIWWNKYLESSVGGSACFDEIALQKVLFEYKKLRYLALPLEYNFRPLFPGVIGCNIKIVHGIPARYRLNGISGLSDKINGSNNKTIRVIYEDAILATYSHEGVFTMDKQSCERWIR